MIIAKWSVPLFKADAQKVADEIVEIGDEATPEQIVEKARDNTTELHKCFTWDDTKAAELYRLQEARQVVRLLVIEPKAEEAEPQAIRMFFKVGTAHGTGYKQTLHILRNEDEYKALLKQAKGELATFRNKYKRLTELDGIFAAIDEVL